MTTLATAPRTHAALETRDDDDPDEDLDDEDPAEAARRAALEAIVLGRAPTHLGFARWAWSSLPALVAAGHALETIEGLDRDGWLCRWSTAVDDEPPSRSNYAPAPSGECLTLTPWAASSLGLEMRETRGNERPYWAPRAEPESRYTPAPRWLRHGHRQIELPDTIQDAAPSPLEELVMVERFTEDGTEGNLEPLKLLGAYVFIDPRLGGRQFVKVSKKKTRKGRKPANVA